MNTWPLTAVIVMAATLLTGCNGWATSPNTNAPTVSNFEACQAAGYPVMESYPARCRTPDGRSFTQEAEDLPAVTSGDNPQPGSVVHDLPVPPAVATVRSHVAKQFGMTEREVLVLEARERQWPNSCLGLQRPDQFCAQVITPGFLVRVRAQGQEFAYRTNLDGSAIQAEE